MRAGEAAAGADVNPQTLRYYERRGLIPEPERTPSGYRSYPDETVSRVRFIKAAQAVGFSLDEVQVLLHLEAGRVTDCAAAQQLAQQKVDELERQILGMTAMRDTLRRFVTECDSARPPGACPLISELGSREKARLPGLPAVHPDRRVGDRTATQPCGLPRRDGVEAWTSARPGQHPALPGRAAAIELLTVPGCPNADRVRSDLSRALDLLHLEVRVVEHIGDHPSPTVLVDGSDVVTGRPPASGAQCRLDVPTFQQLLTALGG